MLIVVLNGSVRSQPFGSGNGERFILAAFDPDGLNIAFAAFPQLQRQECNRSGFHLIGNRDTDSKNRVVALETGEILRLSDPSIADFYHLVGQPFVAR